MISSLETGAVFRIVDEGSPALKLMTDQLKLLNEQAETAKKLLSSIARTSFTELGGKLDTLSASVKGIGDAGASAAEKMAGAFDAATLTMSGSIKKVAEQIAALKVEGAAVGAGGLGPGSGGRGGGSGGGGGWLPSLSSPEMRAGGFGLAGGLLGGPLGVGIAAGTFVGYEGVKADVQLQSIREQLRIGGVSQAEIDKATRAAMTIGPMYGMEPADFLKGINETRNILNKGTTPDAGVEGALAHARTLSMASLVLRAQGGEKGGDVGRDIYDLVKSAEFRNAISDKDFDKAIGSMVQADVATGGIVDPRTWLQMSQYLKGALPGLSDDFLYSYMPELAQEFKGSGAGTAMASLYQQLVAGQMRTSGLRLLDSLGMVDENKVDFDHNGRIVKARPGYFKDDDVFKSNPLLGIEDIIKAMDAHGITNEKDQRDNISMLFGNRNAAQMALTLAYQDMRLGRGAQGIKNTWSLTAASDELLANDPMTQFRKTWADLNVVLIDIGEKSLPAVLGALKLFDDALKALHRLFTWEHPTTNGRYPGRSIPGYGGDGGVPVTLSGRAGLMARLSGVSSGSSSGSLTALINEVSAAEGIDPRIMEGIRAGESGHGSNYDTNLTGSDESYGPFQLNRKHPGDLGSLFQRETGLDLSDPSTIAAQARWVARYIKRTGNLSPWAGYHGNRDADPRWGDSGYVPSSADKAAASPPAPVPGTNGRYPGRPVPGSPWARTGDDTVFDSDSTDPSIHAHSKILHVTLNSVTHLDGKVLARNTAKHLVRANMYPRGPSFADYGALPQGADSGMMSSVSA